MMSDEQTIKPLTAKQRLFVEHYVQCWNASEAARQAGYSEKSARVTSHRMLTKANISRAIKERVAEVAMSADEVLVRLADIARGSMDDFIDDNGAIDLPKAREAGKLYLVRRYKTSEKFGDEIELQDQLKALELIGKNNGALGNLKDALLQSLDVDKLTPPQLRRLAAGDDIIDILLNPNG